MSKKKLGREVREGYDFRLTFAKNDSTQAILLKLDEVIEKLNLIQITGTLAIESSPSVGGDAEEVLVVPGLRATDTFVAASITTQGANNTTLLNATIDGDNALECTFMADPGAGAVVTVTVEREEDSKIETVTLVL